MNQISKQEIRKRLIKYLIFLAVVFISVKSAPCSPPSDMETIIISFSSSSIFCILDILFPSILL